MKEQIQIKILNNVVNLDEPCYMCSNVSNVSRSYDYEDPRVVLGLKKEYENGKHCELCNNIRFRLNEAGQAIVDLMKRHMK